MRPDGSTAEECADAKPAAKAGTSPETHRRPYSRSTCGESRRLAGRVFHPMTDSLRRSRLDRRCDWPCRLLYGRCGTDIARLYAVSVSALDARIDSDALRPAAVD